MEKLRSYNNIIETKLQHLPGAGAEQLWQGMHAILDKEMPQRSRKWRPLAWLMTARGGVFLLALSSAITLYSIFTVFSTYNISEASGTRTPGALTPAPDTKSSAKNQNPLLPGSAPHSDDRNAPVPPPGISEPTSHVSGISSQVPPQQNRNTFSAFANNTRDQKLIQQRAGQNRPQTAGIAIAKEAIVNKDGIVHPGSTQLNQVLFLQTAPAETADTLEAAVLRNSFLFSETFTQHKTLDSVLNSFGALKSFQRGPYAGILTGVDLSSVQFKAMRPGVNTGIVIGYAFSSRWSLETGLFWNKKKYFSDGAYFRPSNYTLPTGVRILSVNGKNQLYELPVNVRFTVLPSKHQLFITGGLSSYLMRSESYEYEYLYNGQSGKTFASYKNQTKDWFSVANLSLGYSHRLGSFGNIRVEPYLKLPLGDIGINNMPVSSLGLNVGFTRKILK